MIRLPTAFWLIGAGIALSGCSNAYYVDLAQVRQQRLATAYEPAPAQRTRVSLRSSEVPPARAEVAREQAESMSTERQTDDIKPWPKRGTPEFERAQVEDAERERRLQQVLNSICRAC